MVAAPFAAPVTVAISNPVMYGPKRTTLSFTNLGPNTFFWGVDAGLSAINGMPVFINQTVTFSFVDGDDPRIARYMICAFAGTADVRIAETYAPIALVPSVVG